MTELALDDVERNALARELEPWAQLLGASLVHPGFTPATALAPAG